MLFYLVAGQDDALVAGKVLQNGKFLCGKLDGSSSFYTDIAQDGGTGSGAFLPGRTGRGNRYIFHEKHREQYLFFSRVLL